MKDSDLKFRGVGTTTKAAVIYVDVVVGGVKYAREVRVPWTEFSRKEIQYEVNLAVAARLRAEWESEAPPWAEDLPLPGIG